MSRVIEQTPTTTVSADDMFLVDGALGTRAIKHSDMSRIYDQEFGPKSLWGDSIPVEVRRNIFRGKNLGPAVTTAQYAAIAAGTFEDLFLGDYWEEVVSETSTRKWRIVDINYWIGTGSTRCTTPHLVIMPDKIMYDAKMNDTDTTIGGYVGSQMYTANLDQAKQIINSFFGSGHILNHKEILINSVTDGYSSGSAWYDSKVELPSEVMVVGSNVFNSQKAGTMIPHLYSINKTLLSLFKIYPEYIALESKSYWLRDIASGFGYSYISSTNSITYTGSSNALGVRPVFGIIG